MKHKRKIRKKAGRNKISPGRPREPIKIKSVVKPFGARR